MAGKPVQLERLMRLAAQLGSDVPFFLLGGTAAVLGRDKSFTRSRICTAGMYCLSRRTFTCRRRMPIARSVRKLTPETVEAKLEGFQARLFQAELGIHEISPAVNDFEPVVFQQHPRLKTIRNQLLRAGASTAMMTGSGSSIFGVFPGRKEMDAAAAVFHKDRVFSVRFVTRAGYRSAWKRRLATQHSKERKLPFADNR